MLKNLGNCSDLINWSKILSELENQEPGYVGPRQSLDDPSVDFIAKIWKECGYKAVKDGGSAQWAMYFPQQHFDIDVVHKFANFVGMDGWNSAWISKILPGHCAPWHVDLQSNVTKTPRRIHCHIDTPDIGHILIIGDRHLINQPQGETYEWIDPKEWHASSNIGKKPAYLFNIY